MLARRWAYLLSPTSYIPLPYAELEQELLGLVNRLLDAVQAKPFTAEPAVAVAARLVELNCVGPDSLRRTVEILGKALFALPELRRVDRLTEKAIAVLGALSAGHGNALRNRVTEQQENMNRSLTKVAQDVSQAARIAEARLDEVVDSSPCGLLVTDLDGKILRANDSAGQIVGRTPAELRRLTVYDLMNEPEGAILADTCQLVVEGTMPRLRLRRSLISADDEQVPVSLIVSLLPDAGEHRQFLMTIRDDSEVTLLQRELTKQSLHDVLTSLPNRQYLTSQLETSLSQASRFGVTLYHLDLDAFSLVANGLGRAVGDQLLKVVADRLKAVVAQEHAVVARFAGDEFGVVVWNTQHTPDVPTMVGRINDELAEPVYIDGQGVAVTASIGVVHRPPEGIDPAELLRASDLALREAKRHGNRQWALYDPEEDARERGTFGLATAMASAWEMGEITVTYQPVVGLDDERPIGVEALLCWQHPDHGPLPHARCVELAERTGLMLSLGEWLLRTACERLAGDSGTTALPLTVSLTNSQATDPDLVGRITRILAETGLPADRLRVGIPAGALLAAREQAVENLTVLADAGISVLVHEFGSPEHLPLLEDLPVDTVRIAHRLVAGQADRADRNSSVSRVLADLVRVVHEIGGTVVVDGVHTPVQARWWRDIGGDAAVGAHFPTAPGDLGGQQ
jgi:diguanylate cyclase (GGDEF)-like protein/PAS domain S-box-containing protein